MLSQNLPDPSEFQWDFEKRGNTGVWFLNGWEGYQDEDLEAVSEHYRKRGKRSDIDGTVAVFGDAATLAAETQAYMGEQWSENAEYVGVDRVAFVSDGITGLAVKSNMDISTAEVDDFDDVAAAVEWAQG
jgi:hypothetical protein